jgi:E3 ubiquitin-protein ligase RGLG
MGTCLSRAPVHDESEVDRPQRRGSEDGGAAGGGGAGAGARQAEAGPKSVHGRVERVLNEAGQYEFRTIFDKYESYEEVAQALRDAGLESSNLIIAIDYTKSNQWTGRYAFGGECLHAIGLPSGVKNPYQKVIEVIGQTLVSFDDDNLIPAFGFGDVTTSDKSVFPFLPDRPCHGFEEVLQRYEEITPRIALSGPTSFAPAIEASIEIVKQTGSYHILVIIADGQVTTKDKTVQAILEASEYPLSIIVVGVGDGPWGMMEEFDDGLPDRRFDNFQFVNYAKVCKDNPHNPDIAFAIAALMEIPEQYVAIRRLKLV